jgi:hypothetical protein
MGRDNEDRTARMLTILRVVMAALYLPHIPYHNPVERGVAIGASRSLATAASSSSVSAMACSSGSPCAYAAAR